MAKGKYEYWLTPEGLLRLEGWARDGATDKQIADNCEISTSTLYEWKKRYPEISESLKKTKEVVDRKAENALLRRGLGCIVTEIIYENGVEVKRTVKELPPDTTALIFWLKNRMRDKYRDKQSIELSRPIDESIKEMEAYFERKKETST